MTFSWVPPTEWMLEVTAAVQSRSWQQCQQLTTPQGYWHAYLNQICLSTLLPWLHEFVPGAAVWSADALLSTWDIVNGTAIQLDTKRLVLLPDKALEARVTVPQEWVDIPTWAGDYYLAVQVNLEGEWLRVWGYTTHEQLKTAGSYDPIDRTYSLDATQLIDLNAFWVARQLCPDEPTQAAIDPLPILSNLQADSLLQQLVQPGLELPFAQWGALLERSGWRQRLYQLRQEDQLRREANQANRRVQLGQWLQNVFDQSWEAIEALFAAPPNLDYSLRDANVDCSIRRVKRIWLEPLNQAVALVVLLEPEAAAVRIRVQLYPLTGDYLPPNVQLSMRSAAGQTVQSVRADEQAEYIQLKQFRCAAGTVFQIDVAIDGFMHTEQFVG